METHTVTVPFSLLCTVNDNDSITPIVEQESSGVEFEVSRIEYDAICAVQDVLLQEEEKKTAIRQIRAGITWKVHPYPNLMMNGYAFSPDVSELEITTNDVTLLIFHNGREDCVVKADVTELLQQIFTPSPIC